MPEVVGRLRTPRLAAAPSSPTVGEVYYDTAANKLLYWNGTEWGTDIVYKGSHVPATAYKDGDIVVAAGVAYVCVRPTNATPTGWPSTPGIPTVVNGQWLKGSGGSAIWAPITEADLPTLTATKVTGLQVADTAWHNVGAAGEPAFQNGWVQYGGYTAARFRKDTNGTVFVQGLVTAGTTGGGVAIFTLPVGYRPTGSNSHRFPVIATNVLGVSNVSTSGVIDLEVGSNGYVFLNSLIFSTL